MVDHEFKKVEKINQVFVPENPVTPDQANALFTDPYYGLQNYNNYGHWQQLIYTDDPLEKQK